MTQSSVVALTLFFIVTVCFTFEPQRDLPRFIGFTLLPPPLRSSSTRHPGNRALISTHSSHHHLTFLPSVYYWLQLELVQFALTSLRRGRPDKIPLYSTALEQPNFVLSPLYQVFNRSSFDWGKKKKSLFFLKMLFSCFELVISPLLEVEDYVQPVSTSVSKLFHELPDTFLMKLSGSNHSCTNNQPNSRWLPQLSNLGNNTNDNGCVQIQGCILWALNLKVDYVTAMHRKLSEGSSGCCCLQMHPPFLLIWGMAQVYPYLLTAHPIPRCIAGWPGDYFLLVKGNKARDKSSV